MSRRNCMHQVSELVEERRHLVERHQAGVAGFAAGEAADQHHFGELPAADAGARGRGRGAAAALAGPRVHVEIDARNEAPVVEHLVRLDRSVPHRQRRCRPELETEQLAADGEHAGPHALVREVRAHGLRVEVVARLPHQLRVVTPLPRVHGRRTRLILFLATENQLVVGVGLLRRRGDNARDERGGVLRRGRHAVGQVERRPVLESERARQLVPRLDQFLQHVEVGRIGDVVRLDQHTATQVVALRIQHHRLQVRGARRQLDRAVRCRLVGGNKIRRQAGQLPGVGHGQGARAVANVAIELLSQADQQVAQFVDLRARGRVLVDAFLAIVVQFQREVAGQVGRRAGCVGAGQRRVSRLVQRQLGFKCIGGLRQGLGRGAHGRIGMKLPNNRRDVPGGAKVHLDVVVAAQGLLSRLRAGG